MEPSPVSPGGTRRVLARVDLGTTGGGGSNSRYVRCADAADGKEADYLVKYRQNPQGLRVLVNELVCGRLAAKLNVPCPEVVIVQVDDEFARASKAAAVTAVEAAEHYGMRRIDFWRNPPPEALARVQNREDFAGMVAFDAWVKNHDRKLDHVLLTRPDFAHGRLYFALADHGHCIGNPGWTAAQLREDTYQRDPSFSLVAEVRQYVPSLNSFTPWLSAIKGLASTLNEVVSDVPVVWKLADDERLALVEFFQKRAAVLDEILRATSWFRGGDAK